MFFSIHIYIKHHAYLFLVVIYNILLVISQYDISCNFSFNIYYFRAAILAISAYLEAFQKIADAATSARGKFQG